MSKSVNSLMKKTKKELVDIILRKDDVENNYINEIKSLKALNEDLTGELNIRKKQHSDDVAKIEELNSVIAEAKLNHSNEMRKSVVDAQNTINDLNDQIDAYKSAILNKDKLIVALRKYNKINSYCIVLLCILIIITIIF